jgi:hypothetical protein
MGNGRSLELVVLHKGSQLGDFASSWMPRLVVVVRGTTDRLDLSVPELAGRVRFGARGVAVGSTRVTEMQWRDVTHEEIVALIDALDALKPPIEVASIVDTIDYFQTTIVSGAVDEAPFFYRVDQMHSGYQGRDAQKFAALMRTLLEVANLDATDRHWASLIDAR